MKMIWNNKTCYEVKICVGWKWVGRLNPLMLEVLDCVTLPSSLQQDSVGPPVSKSNRVKARSEGPTGVSPMLKSVMENKKIYESGLGKNSCCSFLIRFSPYLCDSHLDFRWLLAHILNLQIMACGLIVVHHRRIWFHSIPVLLLLLLLLDVLTLSDSVPLFGLGWFRRPAWFRSKPRPNYFEISPHTCNHEFVSPSLDFSELCVVDTPNRMV